jgi:hypothetical protein
MEKEIEKMVMILKVILEQNEDVRNWSENGRASRGKITQSPMPTRLNLYLMAHHLGCGLLSGCGTEFCCDSP